MRDHAEWRKLFLRRAGPLALAVPVFLGLIAAPCLSAQAQANPSPEVPAAQSLEEEQADIKMSFDVASVKPIAGDPGKAYVQAVPGRLLMQNFSVRALILLAYGVADYQMSGGPSWIASDHYNLQAVAQGSATVQQMEGPMLQALLEDRFKLTIHRELKQLPVYELTLGKGDGKLQPSKEGNCIPYSIDSPPPAAAQSAPRPVFCGFPRLSSNGLNQTLDGAGISIAELAASLSRSQLHRPIIDKTGLTGTFDVHLEWTTDAPSGVGDADPSRPAHLHRVAGTTRIETSISQRPGRSPRH